MKHLDRENQLVRSRIFGRNLMRLVYLDEAGISQNETALVVAGVIIHGDQQSNAVQSKLDELVTRHIPENDRIGFVFHATDIYHGSRYFGDRQKWDRGKRAEILMDLARVIEEFKLPVVLASQIKSKFGVGVLPENTTDKFRSFLIQAVATIDCAIHADRWLEIYAPDENGLLIAEDTDRVKTFIKQMILIIRQPDRLAKQEGLAGLAKEFRLPLRRIIDTCHFAAKEDCAPLQLADLCAFVLARGMKGKAIPSDVWSVIDRHSQWITANQSDQLPSTVLHI